MNAALNDMVDFIKIIPPFNLLSDQDCHLIAKRVSIGYYRNQSKLETLRDDQVMLYLVKKGVVAYYNEINELQAKFSEGDLCSVLCQENIEELQITLRIEEDSLIYSIDFKVLQELLIDYPNALQFLLQTAPQRLQNKMGAVSESALIASSLTNAPIMDYYNSPAITISSQASIQNVAKYMTEKNVSCLVIMADGYPAGIVTDKDIRRRCVATGLSSQDPVTEIMTEKMATIDINLCGHDALALMISQRIHHLPVTSHGVLVGMLTATDLMNQEGHHAVNLSSVIHKASSVDALVELSSMLPKLQVSMAKLGASADYLGKNISALTMAFTIRLIELAEQKLGGAPVSYAWLCAGSQARQEQLVYSDQDNALIIADHATPEQEGWFEAFAHFICDGLAACGYIYCPGNIMATNQLWRQKKQVWQGYFTDWVTQPEPQALLNSCVFFDLTTVHGDSSLLQDVRRNMLIQTQKNTLFLAHLSRNALLQKPPLGFFRDFVLIHDGNNKKGLDLKHNGLAPIINLARIYALAEGIEDVNTIMRLRLAAGTPSLSRTESANLIDAFELLGMLRAEHQAKQIEKGEEADSYLLPKEISRLEREHLKDAFKVVKAMQNYRQMV
ncbi:DUF294 nucleotidyltransferase-like domain-containing protein [Moritella viscosa]|uniref:CBS domain protein n=1 Tax=Moritella viscosa TaxID=80854 RepID=A0ABY1HD41_9GAMM|nr:putative nucleotidyltransferase substrate binding domain-containing protein [Moritella viscosa]SGY87580.1 CBS domain protein [Moritella viscosa]SGY90721.1 CBS domain protein [Moritella viscosa]SGY90757.1 CBS domain protein [Moritella viscosa]SGY94016.1 CBS domain protein [Moritella viscosa]SHO25405.1 CBS domain protein [Moritella viscosa]